MREVLIFAAGIVVGELALDLLHYLWGVYA